MPRVKKCNSGHENPRPSYWSPEYRRAWYEKNKHRINAKSRERYHNDAEYRARKDEANQRWRDKHPEAYRLIQLRYEAKRIRLIKMSPTFAAAESRTRELMKIGIYAAAQAALPARLPACIRDDVITDIMIAHLDGDLPIEDVPSRAKEFLAAHRCMFDEWKTVSLDSPIPGTNGEVTYVDRLMAEEVSS